MEQEQLERKLENIRLDRNQSRRERDISEMAERLKQRFQGEEPHRLSLRLPQTAGATDDHEFDRPWQKLPNCCFYRYCCPLPA